MNFKEQLDRELDREYQEWLKKYGKDIATFTESSYRQYGKIEILCHGRCSETNFTGFPTVKLSDKVFLIKWITDNGFRYYESSNSHGAPMVCWR